MASERIKEAISKNKVAIFSKAYCPFCEMAKRQFQKLNQDFEEIELDNCADCKEAQAILGEMTGAKTVPRVFINGKFVGDGTKVKELYDSGQLEKLLQ